MEFIQIPVEERAQRGTGKARRMRRQGSIPAVLYGLGRPNMAISVAGTELEKFLRTGSRLVELKLSDKTRAAIIREVQHDPVTDEILHVDFVRVDKDVEIEDRVPLLYKGRPKGTTQGGIFQAVSNEIRVRCRPLDLPREIVIDVTGLELNAAVHAKDVALPTGVTLLTPGDDLIAHVVLPKVEVAAEPAPGAEVSGSEPELIRKAPTAEDEEGDDKAAAPKGEKSDKPEKPEKKK